MSAVEPLELGELSSSAPEVRGAILASELKRDVFTRARCANFIGSVASGQDIELQTVPKLGEFESLYDAIGAAAEGNPEAIKVLAANAHTAEVEALYKAGHIMRVRAKITEDWNVIQHGQSMDSVSANSLRRFSKGSKMKPRTEAEALNIHRVKDSIPTGQLHDGYLLIPSLFPDDMSDAQATNAGFFTDTKTGVLQLVTAEADELIIESTFVAGVKEKDGPRHDIDAVVAIYANLGYDVSGLSTTELLANPIWISKEQLPNGGADVARMYDEPIGTFFGQDKPVQDYQEYLQICREREAALDDTTRDVVKDLIASYDHLSTPQDAVTMLYKIVRKRVIEYAADDEELDISIFGAPAVSYINRARQYRADGDIAAANQALINAEVVAKITMCGDGGKNEKKDGNEEANSLINTEESTSGLIKCFKCHQTVNKKDVVKAKTWCCPKCQYEVDICSGDVINDGETKKEEKSKPTKTIYEKLTLVK